MCINCFDMLNTALEFRNKCLQAEGKEPEAFPDTTDSPVIQNFVSVDSLQIKQETEDENSICGQFQTCDVQVKQEPNDIINNYDGDFKIKPELLDEFT